MTTASPTMKAVTRTGWLGMTRTFDEQYVIGGGSGGGGSVRQTMATQDHENAVSNIDIDPTTVLIKVLAAGLNPADYKVPKLVFGEIYGLDLCGVVLKIGDQVNDIREKHMAKAATAAAAATTTAMTMLKVGDIVTGCPVKFKHGSLCEYTLSPALGLSHVQPDWTFVENAGLNVTCCTFMTALQDAGVDISKLQRPAQAQEGQKHVMNQSTTSSPPFKSILILGSSGGCGSVAVQICKGMGIERIVGVCSAKNADCCTQLGATEVVCYDDDTDKLTDFCRQNVGAFDVVYDTVSDGSTDDYLSNPKIMALAKDTNPIDSLKPNYLTLNASPYGWLRTMLLGLPPTSGPPKTCIVMAEYSFDKLSTAIDLITQGGQRPVIDTIISPFSAEGIEEAYKKSKSRRTKGKIIVRVCEDEGGDEKKRYE